MEPEVVGIEKVHRALGTEAVGDDGDAVERERRISARKGERLRLAVSRERRDELAPHPARTDDEVDLAAAVFLDPVDRLLQSVLAHRTEARLRIGGEPAFARAGDAVELLRLEDGLKAGDLEVLGVLHIDDVVCGDV